MGDGVGATGEYMRIVTARIRYQIMSLCLRFIIYDLLWRRMDGWTYRLLSIEEALNLELCLRLYVLKDFEGSTRTASDIVVVLDDGDDTAECPLRVVTAIPFLKSCTREVS